MVQSPADRDRDAAGRPRNARPRDALGRPLERGDQGDDPGLEPPALTAPQALAEAQALLDSGRPFHAHELLEAAWKAAPQNERELWQGLAQLAVGLTHWMRGNRRGASALIRRGQERIAPFSRTPPHGIDVPGLVLWCKAALTQLDQASPGDTGVAGPPRLVSTDDRT